ncbi:hypothetical protein TNCV_2032061 [Trichonephila clavipes]|nr:hypothetical protein TNCV_2032061 [Trichonephila clavipes]
MGRKAVWTDESHFTLFTNDGRQRIRLEQHEALLPDYIQLIVQDKGKVLMIWGAFGWNRIGPFTTIKGDRTGNE